MTKYHFTLGTLAKTKKKDNSTEQDVKKKSMFSQIVEGNVDF